MLLRPWILAGLLAVGCRPESADPLPAASAPAARDTVAVERFGWDRVNTPDDEYGPVLLGDTLFFAKRVVREETEHLVYSVHEAGTWTYPTLLPFSGGDVVDKEPYPAPDGQRLYFASNRLVDGQDLDFELWYVDRTPGGWSAPQHLAALGSPQYENYPAVAAGGNLYFSSKRATDHNDLYIARWVDGAYQPPEPLTALNTPASDADPYIDPAERFLIFSSSREGGRGGGDLYLSRRQADGTWGAPLALDAVNSDAYEYTPFVSPDGRTLYFSRDWGEMLRVPVEALGVSLTHLEGGAGSDVPS